jgi:hypothetical protein
MKKIIKLLLMIMMGISFVAFSEKTFASEPNHASPYEDTENINPGSNFTPCAEMPYLVQLEVARQPDTIQCGHRTAIHAAIIDRIIADKAIDKFIYTSGLCRQEDDLSTQLKESATQLIDQYVTALGNRELDPTEIVNSEELYQEENNVFVLGQIPGTSGLSMYGHNGRIEDLGIYFAQLQQKEKGTLNFIFHKDGNHWVLLSCIKHANNSPLKFYYMDSFNHTLSKEMKSLYSWINTVYKIAYGSNEIDNNIITKMDEGSIAPSRSWRKKLINPATIMLGLTATTALGILCYQIFDTIYPLLQRMQSYFFDIFSKKGNTVSGFNDK